MTWAVRMIHTRYPDNARRCLYGIGLECDGIGISRIAPSPERAAILARQPVRGSCIRERCRADVRAYVPTQPTRFGGRSGEHDVDRDDPTCLPAYRWCRQRRPGAPAATGTANAPSGSLRD